MKEFLAEDMVIAVSAAELTLTEHQRFLIERHQEIYLDTLGDVEPHSREGESVYYQTMEQVEGAYEAYQLLDQLTDFNLARLLNRPQS